MAVIFGNPETTELFSQLALYRHSAYLPTSFERLRSELNRKELKLERYRLIETVMTV